MQFIIYIKLSLHLEKGYKATQLFWSDRIMIRMLLVIMPQWKLSGMKIDYTSNTCWLQVAVIWLKYKHGWLCRGNLQIETDVFMPHSAKRKRFENQNIIPKENREPGDQYQEITKKHEFQGIVAWYAYFIFPIQ